MSRAPYLVRRAPKKDNFWWRAFSSSTLDGADRTRPHLATCTFPLRDSLTCPHKYLGVVRHVNACINASIPFVFIYSISHMLAYTYSHHAHRWLQVQHNGGVNHCHLMQAMWVAFRQKSTYVAFCTLIILWRNPQLINCIYHVRWSWRTP